MRRCDVVLVAALLLSPAAPVRAQGTALRASVRNYDFLRLQDKPGDEGPRYHAEFASVRLMPRASFGAVEVEAHLVVDLVSPAGSPSAALATARARTFFSLDRELHRTEDIELTAFIDRLNVRARALGADLVVGRQAISWGVNAFWPALDLFAPFAPLRFDRDYKSGVDAARLTVPLGSHSELQVIGAVLGDSAPRDRAAAALLRISTGPADIGLMAGSFHGDTVVGGFVSASLAGTLVRGELAWTGSGDAADRVRRQSFWRGGIGFERQLTASLNLVAELAANGYGASSVLDYPAVLVSDRLRRGELGGVGRWLAGSSLAWQFHPLGVLTNTALLNCVDRSVVWVPWLLWSVTANAELIAGGEFAFGAEPAPGGIPRSEYGSTANRLLAGLKVHL